jgi:hypothetical protein
VGKCGYEHTRSSGDTSSQHVEPPPPPSQGLIPQAARLGEVPPADHGAAPARNKRLLGQMSCLVVLPAGLGVVPHLKEVMR